MSIVVVFGEKKSHVYHVPPYGHQFDHQEGCGAHSRRSKLFVEFSPFVVVSVSVRFSLPLPLSLFPQHVVQVISNPH